MKYFRKFSIKFAILHFLISGLIAIICAFIVYRFWYPSPFGEVQAVSKIFWIAIAVDVSLGPLLTFLVVKPEKNKRERVVDLSVIGALQAAALIYALHILWQGRPVVFAFEGDRIVLVSAAEIDRLSLQSAPNGLRELPWAGFLKVATRKPRTNEEFLESVDRSLGGNSPATRPDWWQPISQQETEMKRKVKPLTQLLAVRPNESKEIKQSAQKTGYSIAELEFLPLTSAKTKEWVVLFNPSLDVVGYAAVDGFID